MIEFLTLLARRWRLVATVTVLVVAASAVVTILMTPTYRAESQLYVALASDSGEAADRSQGLLFSANVVKSYPDIVKSPLVLDPVIAELGLDTTAAELAGSIGAEVPPNTVLIDVSADDESPAQAAAIANAVSQSFITVVGDLDRTGSEQQSPVRVNVVRPAIAPESPRMPIPWLFVTIGLLLGLALGIAAAALRQALDVTIHGEADVEAATGLPTLAVVPVNPDVDEEPVLSPGRSNPIWAEAYRKLRTNLGFLDPDNPPRTLVVTSALAGDGKTITAVNLAASLAQSGRRVVLLEADLRRPAISNLLHVVPDVGVTNLVSGKVTVEQVTQPYEGFDVITCGTIPPNPSELLGSQAFGTLLQTLLVDYDHIIIDTPPLIAVTDAAVVAMAADAVILVCQAKRTKRPELTKALYALNAVDGNVVGVVLNRVQVADSPYYYSYHPRRGEGRKADKSVKADRVERTPRALENDTTHRSDKHDTHDTHDTSEPADAQEKART